MTSTGIQHKLTDKQIEDALFSILKDEDPVSATIRVNQFITAYNDSFYLFDSVINGLSTLEQLRIAVEVCAVRINSRLMFEKAEEMALVLIEEIEQLDLVDWAMDTIKYNRT